MELKQWVLYTVVGVAVILLTKKALKKYDEKKTSQSSSSSSSSAGLMAQRQMAMNQNRLHPQHIPTHPSAVHPGVLHVAPVIMNQDPGLNGQTPEWSSLQPMDPRVFQQQTLGTAQHPMHMQHQQQQQQVLTGSNPPHVLLPAHDLHAKAHMMPTTSTPVVQQRTEIDHLNNAQEMVPGVNPLSSTSMTFSNLKDAMSEDDMTVKEPTDRRQMLDVDQLMPSHWRTTSSEGDMKQQQEEEEDEWSKYVPSKEQFTNYMKEQGRARISTSQRTGIPSRIIGFSYDARNGRMPMPAVPVSGEANCIGDSSHRRDMFAKATGSYVL